MQKTKWTKLGIPVVLGILAFCLARPEPHQRLSAQAPDDADVERDETETEAPGPEALERRLNEIQELLERAKQSEDQEAIKKLRREGEKILDRLEEIERAREGGEDEGEEFEERRRDLEMHRMELEIEQLRLQLRTSRMESAIRLAEIAQNDIESASYGIVQAVDHLGEEAAADFLADLLTKTENKSIQRLIRHSLVRLHVEIDQPEEAKADLKSLILGK